MDSLPFPPRSEYSDAVISHWPNALFLRQSVLEDHTWPLWRPWIMSGQPFAANPLNKAWYPPQWLVFLLPPILHLNTMIWLHLVLAGAGAWVWSRSTGLKAWAAALVGLGYVFAPRIWAAVGAGHLDLVYAEAWLPWLLWAVHRAVQPVPARRSALWLGVFAALSFLADIRLCLYTLTVAAAYLLWRWRQTRVGIRRLGLIVLAAALLAVALTAVQWVPLLMLQPDLSRSTITTDEAALYSLEWAQWIGLLIGDHGGSWETMVYSGISILILAITALLLRPRPLAFWGIVLLVLALYALGNHFILWKVLINLIPPLRWWRIPSRTWLIAALILPYLAGWGAQWWVESPSSRRIVRMALVVLVFEGVLCSAISTIMLSPPLKITAVLGTLALPATALVMLLANRLSARVLLVSLVLIVLADVLWIDRTLVEGRSKQEWLQPYQKLAEYLKDNGVSRTYSPSYSLPQQAAAYWEIPQFDGVDPFQFSAYQQVAEAASGISIQGYTVTIPPYELENEANISSANQDVKPDPKLLGQWAVSHVLTGYEIQVNGLEFEKKIGDVYIYRNTLAPGVSLDWHGPNEVTIQAAQPLEGPLYAVAAGRWKDHREKPGLPGHVNGQTWTLVYDSSEVWVSLGIGSILIVFAFAISWISRRV